MNTDFSDLLATVHARTITVRAADGHPMAQLKALHAALAVVAGLAIAPRVTALAALGGLVKGVTLSVESTTEPDAV